MMQTEDSNAFLGLNAAEVAENSARYGKNVLTPPQRTSLWKLYLEKFKDPIILILIVAAVISIALAFYNHNFIEPLGILIAIFLATTIGFLFEMDANRKFNLLTAMNEEQKVKVRRDGKVVEIARKDVVVGDVVLIETGDEIPADGKLIFDTDLQIDESSLTGEPIAMKSAKIDENEPKKDASAYPANVVLRSSMVMGGRGTYVVTAVGDSTEIGKVAHKSSEVTMVKTPLSIQLNKLAKYISLIGGIVAFATLAIFIFQDIHKDPTIWIEKDWAKIAEEVLRYFMVAVTLLVMAVPEGLPMAITLSLAMNMRRMLKSNNLVRKLHACETMGAVTVICTDKTGTLTQNKMQVRQMYQQPKTSESLLEKAIAVNSTAELNDTKGIGNPTEVALLLWLKARNIDYGQLRWKSDIVQQIPFSTEKKYMATMSKNGDFIDVFVKGAPEIILSMCSIHPVDLEEVNQQLVACQRQAMRTIAFAYKKVAAKDEINLDNLSFQGFAAISDPIREDVPAAVAECQQAGIKIKIVTGDTSATAIEIARQIGIWPQSDVTEEQSNAWHITGAEWAALSDEEALERAPKLRVMSRARPTDKQRLVELLQKTGEIVAVTGDGTNDAPALHHAHVGLSLGSGTNVAKEASDITLLDDSFHSIANAVMWGRSIYKNIQRFLFFQLTVNLTALVLFLVGSFFGRELPLTVTQILWVNLIMDTFAAMALASLPPSHAVMNEKPRNPKQFIITKSILRGILFWGLAFAIGMLIYWKRILMSDGIDINEETRFFTIFVMLQFWNLFNAKALGTTQSAFHNIKGSAGFWLIAALIFIGQILIVQFGGKQVFRVQPISMDWWTKIVGGTFAVLVLGEIYRAIRRWTK